MNIIPKSIRTVAERQNKILENIPKIEIPEYRFPKIDTPNIGKLSFNYPELNIPKFDFSIQNLLKLLRGYRKLENELKIILNINSLLLLTLSR